jgi:hypothetical protein
MPFPQKMKLDILTSRYAEVSATGEIHLNRNAENLKMRRGSGYAEVGPNQSLVEVDSELLQATSKGNQDGLDEVGNGGKS